MTKERFCFNCGTPIPGDNYQYDRFDTCGAMECEYVARDERQGERDEAHEQLDRDMGWF